MMLLELCDISLKEWLNWEKSFTAAMLDDILLFVLNIAKGVEFLHSKRVNFHLSLITNHLALAYHLLYVICLFVCARWLPVLAAYHSVNSSSHSVNGDIAIQWEWSNFDPSQNPNPLTDYDKTLHN